MRENFAFFLNTFTSITAFLAMQKFLIEDFYDLKTGLEDVKEDV